jgi:hypothetical protein
MLIHRISAKRRVVALAGEAEELRILNVVSREHRRMKRE